MTGRAVYVRLKGGLGNQMFQYAAGLSLARHHDCPLRLDLSYCARDPLRDFALSGFGIEGPLAAPSHVAAFKVDETWRRRLGKLAGRRDLLLPRGMFVEPHFHYDESFFDRSPPVFLDGYWQSPRYFAGIADDIHAAFSAPVAPSPAYVEMRRRIGEASDPVSVHVRRGDYVTGKAAAKMAGSCSPAYYARAIAVMRRLLPRPTFFVFSDEPDVAARLLALAEPQERDDTGSASVIVHGDPMRPVEDLALMAACRHHIIANSSFSWWGAWLNSAVDKTVIAPRLWFSPAYLRKASTVDLYPDEWITIG